MATGFLPSGDPTLSRAIEPYFLSGFGGTEVGAFDAQAGRVQPVEWLSQNQFANVDRNRELQFNWTGGGAGNLVMAFGVSGTRVGGSSTDPIIDGTAFFCSASASAGRLTVTPETLRQLPPGVGLVGIQTVAAEPSGRFGATLATGEALAFGQMFLSVGNNVATTFR